MWRRRCWCCGRTRRRRPCGCAPRPTAPAADHKLVQLTLDAVRLPMPFDQIQCESMTGWHGGRRAIRDGRGWSLHVERAGADALALTADGRGPGLRGSRAAKASGAT